MPPRERRDHGWRRYATIKGFEVMHALRKGQAALFEYGGGIMAEVRLIERQFNVDTA